MDDKVNEYLSFLNEYSAFLENMIDLQNKKIEALLTHEPENIEKVLVTEQSLSIQINKFEDERLKLQANAGFSDMTFSQIISQISDNDLKEQFKSCFNIMLKNIEQVKFLNKRAMDMIETNLQIINLNSSMKKNSNVSHGYTGKGQQTDIIGNMSLLNSKI